VTRILGVVGLLLVLYAVLIASHPNAGGVNNLMAVANRQGRLGIITLGAALVIITGGIDLSIGSVMGCAAVMFGVLVLDGVHPYAALPLVVLFGMGVGLANGLLVTRLRLQPFLVTLCGMFIVRGVARLVGATVSMGNIYQGEGAPHKEFEEPLKALRYVLVGKDEVGAMVFPAMFIILLVLAGVVGFFLHRSAYGRYWYAIGHSELAAKYAGVNVNRHRTVIYVVCSALAAFMGVLFFLDTGTVQSDNVGVGWELYAILGAVLGGCSLRGGDGTAVGMVLGAMVLPVIESIVNFRGYRSDLIPLIVGVTLLIGTVVDELVRRRSRAQR
jgi:ribose transport system permease protein